MRMPQAGLIKEKRLEMGMTMKQLGQKVGVTTATVSRWESGEISTLKAETIRKVADALHVSPLVFIGEDMATIKTIKIPVIGRVVAGTPIFAQENIEGMVEINEDGSTGVMFALKVIGSNRKAGKETD